MRKDVSEEQFKRIESQLSAIRESQQGTAKAIQTLDCRFNEYLVTYPKN